MTVMRATIQQKWVLQAAKNAQLDYTSLLQGLNSVRTAPWAPTRPQLARRRVNHAPRVSTLLTPACTRASNARLSSVNITIVPKGLQLATFVSYWYFTAGVTRADIEQLDKDIEEGNV